MTVGEGDVQPLEHLAAPVSSRRASKLLLEDVQEAVRDVLLLVEQLAVDRVQALDVLLAGALVHLGDVVHGDGLAPDALHTAKLEPSNRRKNQWSLCITMGEEEAEIRHE